MEEAATPPNFGHAVQSRDEAPAGDRIAISTSDFLVCLDRAGVELWRFDFGPGNGVVGSARTNCRFSLDGNVVWLYRPDLYSGHGETDRWFALDAADGAILGDAALPTVGGHGGSQLIHPDGVHVFLQVGCGQDGCFVFKGWIEGGVTSVPWPVGEGSDHRDRWIAALSPDGGQIMAFECDDEVVTFRDCASGAVQWQITLQDFGFDLEADRIETIFLWSGRYVGDGIAIVEFKGETGEVDEHAPDWAAAGIGELDEYRAYAAIDLHARRVLGPAGADGAYTGEHPRFVPEPR
jgi:hypothetical protein